MTGAIALDGAAADPRVDSTATPLRLAIALAVALQLGLAFLQPVNWDEFRFLSDIYQHQRGELTAWLQTIHVHAFGWLTRLPGNEAEQIVAGRLVMLALEVGTLGFIYRCSRNFMDERPALLAVLVYATCSYVLRHGASFRFDPLAAFLLMAALTLLLDEQLTRMRLVIAGSAVALAGLVTVKAAFYLPTLAIILWARWAGSNDRAGLLRQIIISGASAVALFALIAFLHRLSLAAPDAATADLVVANGFEKTIADAGLMPRASVLIRSLLADPVQWLLVGAGLWLAARGSRVEARLRAILIALALPLLTLFFYRNAFPYYYAFILPPAAILAGFAVQQLGRPLLYRFLAFGLPALAMLHAAQALTPVRAAQLATIDAVHAIFPRPVAYIDRSSMIASFPKSGFFMSSWGMESYLSRRTPVMADLLRRDSPLFVIANSPALTAALTGTPSDIRLLPEDEIAIRSSYIPHWGALWVAGKRLQASSTAHSFELFVPGLYTIEAAGPVILDRQPRQPGDVVRLDAGTHSIVAGSGLVSVTLRIGDHLPIPADTPPDGPIFGDL